MLLPIFSLPSRFGIGDLGNSAYRFADRLQAAGQRYWQVLPLNPPNTGASGSPYDSCSNYAGNPLLIDLAALARSGLLTDDDLILPHDLPANRIDYEQVSRFKMAALDKAASRLAQSGGRNEFEDFRRQQQNWLDDYSLFMALKAEFPGQSWTDWPAGPA